MDTKYPALVRFTEILEEALQQPWYCEVEIGSFSMSDCTTQVSFSLDVDAIVDYLAEHDCLPEAVALDLAAMHKDP